MSGKNRNGPPSRPSSMSDAIEVARRLYLGETAVDAAAAVGVSTRTIRRWRRADWWQEVEAAARDAYYDQLTGRARATVLEAVGDDHWLAWKVLSESRRAEPPTLRDEEGRHVIGSDAGVIVLPDNGRGL